MIFPVGKHRRFQMMANVLLDTPHHPGHIALTKYSPEGW